MQPKLIKFQQIGEKEIGYISVAQYDQNLPFEVKRVYWVYGTPENVERGNHAHREGKTVLVAVAGEVEVILENIKGEEMVFLLNDPNVGLFVPNLHWRKIHIKNHGALISLASMEYKEEDYIREYEIFKGLC
ncbi:MAG: sugar 3,4-ketoisomerase [Cytophagaceae bacterium]